MKTLSRSSLSHSLFCAMQLPLTWADIPKHLFGVLICWWRNLHLPAELAVSLNVHAGNANSFCHLPKNISGTTAVWENLSVRHRESSQFTKFLPIQNYCVITVKTCKWFSCVYYKRSKDALWDGCSTFSFTHCTCRMNSNAFWFLDFVYLWSTIWRSWLIHTSVCRYWLILA